MCSNHTAPTKSFHINKAAFFASEKAAVVIFVAVFADSLNYGAEPSLVTDCSLEVKQRGNRVLRR